MNANPPNPRSSSAAAGRPHRGLGPRRAQGVRVHGPRGRHRRRRHRRTVRVQGLPLRHRRSPLLHQGPRRRGAVGRDARARRCSRARGCRGSTTRQLLRLPAQGRATRCGPRPGQRGAESAQLLLARSCSRSSPRSASRTGCQPLRPDASTRPSSRPTRRRCGAFPAPDWRAVGGAAHQGPVALAAASEMLVAPFRQETSRRSGR